MPYEQELLHDIPEPTPQLEHLDMLVTHSCSP